MSCKRCPEEFKIEALKQVVDRDYSAVQIVTRLGMMTNSHCTRARKHGPDSPASNQRECWHRNQTTQPRTQTHMMKVTLKRISSVLCE